MKLPTLDVSTFSIVLPSTQEKIELRPYLVKEEKLLLAAQEADNPEDAIDIVSQVIRNCSLGNVNPATAPYFDVEYLFLQLRAHSVGEIASPIYQCANTIKTDVEGEELPCKHQTTIKIDLTKIPVEGIEEAEALRIIDVDEKWRLKLRYPTIRTINRLAGEAQTLESLDTLRELLDSLIAIDGGGHYSFDDYSPQEQTEFMESLAPPIYEKILNFLIKLPTIKFELSYTCEKCQFEHHLHLSGLTDFFD